MCGTPLAAGMVDKSCYEPDAPEYSGHNLADALSLTFSHTSLLADLLEAAFARKLALQLVQELCGAGCHV
jgi:hypothetical protein